MKKILLALSIVTLIPLSATAAMQTFSDGDDLSEVRTKLLTNDTELYGYKVASGSVSGNNLTLVLADTSTIVVDISTLLDNTDAQTVTTLSLNASTNILTLTLSGGNTETVDLSGLVGGGLADAPSDGSTYGRKDGAWVVVSGTGTVDSVNGQTGTVVLDADDIDDSATTNKFATAAQLAAIDINSAKTGVTTEEQNVNADWDAVSGDEEILNKPTTISAGQAASIAANDAKVSLTTTNLNLLDYTPTSAVDLTGASSVSLGPIVFSDTDGSPSSVGMFRYDNTVTGLTDGAMAYHNGTQVRYLVDLDAAPSDDDYVIAYDAAADKFYMKLDATGSSSITDQITVLLDGGGSAITTGIKMYVPVEWAGTITQATMLCDQSATIVVDIWKDTYANYPPTDADSITASAVPGTSAALKDQDATLTGWTTAITAGDSLAFNVDANDSAEYCTVSLKVTR